MKKIKSRIYWLTVVVLMLGLCGCNHRGCYSDVLSRADELIDEQPDSAYALLNTIDGSALREGSELQARYALLYTKAQYKSYNDPTSDSLINIAVDYYEAHGNDEDRFYAYLYQGIVRYLLSDINQASSSFLRAIANSDEVDDHYAKGQVYTYMSQINSLSHCTDEEEYARKAHHEYLLLGKDFYIINSLLNLSVALMHQFNYPSSFLYVDSCISLASSSGNAEMLAKAISSKANCALLADSINLSISLYRDLLSLESYQPKEIDYSNIAYLFADRQQSDSALYYLSLSKSMISTKDDRVNYWAKSVWVNNKLKDKDQIIASQDSLLGIQEGLLAEAMLHTAIAEQRDYSEKQLLLSEKKNVQKNFFIAVLLICLILFISTALIIRYRLKIIILQQAEKIQKLQLDIQKHANEITLGLEALRTDAFVSRLHEKAREQRGMNHEELDYLHDSFNRNLPHFEKSLRELAHISDTELQVCMLLKLYMTPGEISVLLNKSAGAISSIRGRLYQKVFKKKGSTSDWDAFIDTI